MNTTTTADVRTWGGCRPVAFTRPGVSLAKTPRSIAEGQLRSAVNAGLRSNNLRSLQLFFAGV